jgi:exosortase
MVTPQKIAGVSFGKWGFSWPLAVGFCALAIPTAYLLGTQTWSQEEGAHGPLVLFTAAWLLWRQLPEIRHHAVSGKNWVVGVSLTISLAMYIIGQAFDFITLSAAGLYGVGVCIFYALFGAREIVRNWFIFTYLLFAVPPPRSWLDTLTFPLKQFVSSAATAILEPFGIPVTHEGVIIYVAQYQYLVEDACSGLNSIIGLLAITLFYVYLTRGSSWRYSIFLAALTIPIAIMANILRIIILILLTLFMGDGVAQGFMHFTAGIIVFVIALALVASLDSLFATVLPGRKEAA